MTNDDAELLLDDNFIATENNNPFDSAEDENNSYYAEPKYKKKNDFNFTSLWRKPKIGRRKPKSIGKNQDAYEKTFNDNSSSLKTRGKYFKDRESFETMASVPLSDFDEAKDTLPFLHLRPGFSNLGGEGKCVKSNARMSLKERTVLNPKMFLTQAPANRRENKNQIRKDSIVGGKLDEDESRDIFKPIHNNNNHFDAFQILPKGSPNKVKTEDETQKKQKEEEADGTCCDKENFFQDSIYCGDLYHDHGPILSSLSEDTINSDFVLGEQFLEGNLNENIPETDPKNNWNASNNDIEGREEESQGFRDVSNQNEVQRVELIPPVDPSATIETSVCSFSDRLKIFQSKANHQPAQQSRYDSIKSKSNTPMGNLPDPTVIKHEEEANENFESALAPAIPELEIPAPDLEKFENPIERDISKPGEQVIDEAHQVTSELKTNDTTHSHSSGRNMISSRVERNYFKQHITTGARASKSSYQSDSSEHIDDKKSLTLNSFRDSSSKFGVLNSKKSQTKVVDLSMIGTYKNQVVDKGPDIDESDLPTNYVEPTLCSEEKKMDSMKAGEDSRSNSLQNTSGVPMRSIRSYSTTKCRFTSNSQESVRAFGGTILGQRDSKAKDIEGELITNLTDRGSNLRKSSLNPQSEKTNVEYSAPSLETCTPSRISLDTTPLESENKMDPKGEASNDSMANTSTSSLSCHSIPRTSFAQQSASIFGVTLSKTRQNRIENASENEETVRLNEKSIAAVVCAEKPIDDSQTTRTKSDVVENNPQENENKEKQNSICEEYRRRKISNSSISTYGVDRKIENETLQLEQEEGSPIVEHSLSNRHNIGSSRQPVKFNENEGMSSLDDRRLSDTFDPKVEPVFLPRKVKTLSISDRRKMFEQATARNQIVFSRDSDDFKDTACTDSPKSLETSGSPLFDDMSISTKRRSTDSGTKSVNDGLQIRLGQVKTSSSMPDENYSDDEDEDEDIVGDRRKTLKSTQRGTRGTLGLFQPQTKSYEVALHVVDKSEIPPNNNPKDINFGEKVDDDDNRLENRSNTLKILHQEKSMKNSCKEPSPPKTAYSARRKFFENLDRKRVQSSMARPLVKQTEPITITVKSHEEHEIESFKDGSYGLPMFVTVEEDFMMKDNISTCLSASENRSVICKPDALLYSVSQKAIALMSAKAEKNSTTSISKTYRGEDKETIHNDLGQKRLLAQRLKLNREESSNNVTTTIHSQLRSRFARKKATNTEQDCVDDAQDEDDKDIGLHIENQQTNKFRTSDFSQRSNGFAKKKITSEEADVGTDVRDKNDMKCLSSIENKELNKMRTTAPFPRSKYNRFTRKKAESEICDESKTQQSSSYKEVIIDVNNDTQEDVGDKSRPSMESIERLKNNEKYAAPFARQFESNNSARKNFVLEMRNESESKYLHESEENTADHVRNPDDEVRFINENPKSAIEDKDVLEKKKTPTNNNIEGEPGSQQIGSMSIRERRKFFESQCEKVDSADSNKVEKEESTVQNNSRKSSVSISNRYTTSNHDTKIRRSEDSEITPLVGASIVEQCGRLANNNSDSDQISRTSDLQKRVSSTSTGTLDYSLPSSSNSRPSDLCKRAGSTSTYSHGTSSAPIYRKGFSSTAIRLSTAGQGKKKSDLRCF